MTDTGELDTVDKCRNAVLRLLGTTADDPALIEHGEEENEVIDLFLTRGSRAAQRWMLKMGYVGWRKRSSALSFSGTDTADGGRYMDLPTDFLRAYGKQRDSAIRQTDGTRWGCEIHPKDDFMQGDFYYIRGTQLWVTRLASLPTTVYLDYHYKHPAWGDTLDDDDIDFPMDVRPLIIAESADAIKEDNWLPGGPDMIAKIDRALRRAREDARDLARPTKQPRQMEKGLRFGNHW